MFYIRDDKWGVFPKKIEFKTKHTVYDMEASGYEEDENNTEIVINDVILTDEQKARFELIRNSKDLSIDEVREYVLNNDILETNYEMDNAVNHAKVLKEMEKYLQWDNLGQETIDAMLGNYETWEPSQTYPKDMLLTYGNQMYKVKDFHNSVEGWTPDVTSVYYTPIGIPGTVKKYEIRDGSNPYMKGDPVMFNGFLYICIEDNTVWSPEEAPNNWKKDIPEGVVEDWVQKTYFKGEEVMFEGVHYISIFEGHNVWSPGAYPSGWEVVPK